MTAAYVLVDLSEVDDDLRKKIVNDANAGGGEYGLRVVEEVINGGARAPIYGYYKDGPDADRWNKSKDDLGLSASDVDDGDVLPQQPEFIDPRREAFLREQAAAQAAGIADRIRAGDDAAVEAIVQGQGVATQDTGADNTHSSNIVDTTLRSDDDQMVAGTAPTSENTDEQAENKPAKTEEREERSTSRTSNTRNKAPK